MKQIQDRQKGSVSLFIVIFAALLIITIGTAFIVIMIQGQGQATSDDLSRSALDSANAGVEDTKRAIAQYNKNDCASPSNNLVAPCSTLINALFKGGVAGTTTGDTTTSCTVTIDAKAASRTNGTQTEVQVGGDPSLNQAYTCVNVQMNTPNYVGTLAQGESRLIPLRTVAGQPFDTVVLEWYSQTNLQAAPVALQSDGSKQITLGATPGGPGSLAKLDDWSASTPSLIRTQLLQFASGSFQLGDFDKRDSGSASNANTATLFLYPWSGGYPNTAANTLNFTQGFANPLWSISCNDKFTTKSTGSGDGYACQAILKLPDPIGGSAANRTAYLRLMAPYNTSTDFSVAMQNGGSTVYFGGVQPLVDATGRANDLFRRVKDRVEPAGNGLPYPEGALDVGHDLCKAFKVGESASDYTPASGCTP